MDIDYEFATSFYPRGMCILSHNFVKIWVSPSFKGERDWELKELMTTINHESLHIITNLGGDCEDVIYALEEI